MLVNLLQSWPQTIHLRGWGGKTFSVSDLDLEKRNISNFVLTTHVLRNTRAHCKHMTIHFLEYHLRMTCPAVTWVENREISDNADPTVDDHAQAAKENSSEAVPVTTCQFSWVLWSLQTAQWIWPVFSGWHDKMLGTKTDISYWMSVAISQKLEFDTK